MGNRYSVDFPFAVTTSQMENELVSVLFTDLRLTEQKIENESVSILFSHVQFVFFRKVALTHSAGVKREARLLKTKTINHLEWYGLLP